MKLLNHTIPINIQLNPPGGPGVGVGGRQATGSCGRSMGYLSMWCPAIYGEIYWLDLVGGFNHLEKYESQSMGGIIPYIICSTL